MKSGIRRLQVKTELLPRTIVMRTWFWQVPSTTTILVCSTGVFVKSDAIRVLPSYPQYIALVDVSIWLFLIELRLCANDLPDDMMSQHSLRKDCAMMNSVLTAAISRFTPRLTMQIPLSSHVLYRLLHLHQKQNTAFRQYGNGYRIDPLWLPMLFASSYTICLTQSPLHIPRLQPSLTTSWASFPTLSESPVIILLVPRDHRRIKIEHARASNDEAGLTHAIIGRPMIVSEAYK